MGDDELQSINKLIRNYNNIINKSQYKLTESENMNNVKIADLKQYHIITNTLIPTPTQPLPPMTTVNENANRNKKINENINGNGAIAKMDRKEYIINNLPPPMSINNTTMKSMDEPMTNMEPIGAMQSMNKIPKQTEPQTHSSLSILNASNNKFVNNNSNGNSNAYGNNSCVNLNGIGINGNNNQSSKPSTNRPVTVNINNNNNNLLINMLICKHYGNECFYIWKINHINTINNIKNAQRGMNMFGLKWYLEVIKKMKVKMI